MKLAAYGELVLPLALRGLEDKTLDPYLAWWSRSPVPRRSPEISRRGDGRWPGI